jgi:BirA family biotin operon repressor/biotin-[acetyl-CoA-carboxylase] ligase
MAFSLGPRARSRGYGLTEYPSVGSTNVEAIARAREGLRGPHWFVTREQTAGRGRRQRPWVSPPGNLAVSILETVTVTPPLAATLGFVAGLSLDAALRASAGHIDIASVLDGAAQGDARVFSLKWPNDVLADSAKLAGILLESEPVAGRLAVVVGIGVNVVAAPTDVPYPATSLAALGKAVTAEDLFAALSDAWTNFRAIWDDGQGLAEIRRLWLARAAGLGGEVAVRHSGEVLRGTFETIDDDGRLVVLADGGRRVTISAGDVHFGTTASVREIS